MGGGKEESVPGQDRLHGSGVGGGGEDEESEPFLNDCVSLWAPGENPELAINFSLKIPLVEDRAGLCSPENLCNFCTGFLFVETYFSDFY